MDFLTPLQSMISTYLANPQFVQCVGITFIILEALQKINAIDKWAAQYKQLAALVIGALLGVILITHDVAGLIAGIIAGFSTTLVYDKINDWVMTASGTTPTTTTTTSASVQP